MRPNSPRHQRRATVLVLIIGLLTMLFVMLASFLTLARSERQAVVQTSRGAQTEGVVDNLTDVVASFGIEAPTGKGYTTIPGFGDSTWLAANNPYRIGSNFSVTTPDDYGYTAVTGLSGALPADPNVSGNRTIRDLGFNPSFVNDDEWRRSNARRPFMDADGDGVPDADFRGSALATQIANAIGGRSINADITPDPNIFGSSPEADRVRELWRLFEDNARFEAAVRIISHGGMIQIASPSDTQRWNSTFLVGMFNYLKDTRDNAANLNPSNTSDLAILNAVYAQRGEAEAFLRYRGGILSPRTATGNSSGIAAIDQLSQRIAGYGEQAYSLFPSYADEGNRDSYERFNLADASNQWELWRRAVAIDAADTLTEPRRLYSERRDLTTVNNSDELARIQSSTSGDGTPRLGTGSLKFYLGRAQSAFKADGTFSGIQATIQLSSYFGEMLANYDGWRATPNFTILNQPVVQRNEQARMLAVNTLAFAAPHTSDPNSGIQVDVPWHVEDRGSGQYRIYFGAGPQPYISQVLVYKAEDSTDPNIVSNAAAVEFFNPHDFNLDPSQFGISVVNPSGGTEVIKRLDPTSTVSQSNIPLRFDARKFSLLVVDDGSNDWFRKAGQSYDGVPGTDIPHLDTDVPNGGTELRVRLWRLAKTRPAEMDGASTYVYGSGVWVMVDEFKSDQPEDKDPNYSGSWPGSYVDTWRDTSTEAYWVTSVNGVPRWRVVIPADDEVNKPDDKPEQSRLNDLGDNGPSYTGGVQVPTTPLYTMTPLVGATKTPPIHGVARPSAFPTVGFMHFIGRFSHTFSNVGDLKEPWVSANEWLEYQWRYESQTQRADLAFMPVFSNKQNAFAQSEFSDDPTVGGEGRIPWGLLVYDYFTTLDPNDPNGDGDTKDKLDPMRVDGRININTAPWHVLAALPVIGPNPAIATYPYDLPFDRTTSSSLRDAATNVLNGSGPTEPRLLQAVLNGPVVDPNEGLGWYRIGEPLAQAVAGYRDGVSYSGDADPNTAFYLRATTRNINASGTGPEYRDAIYDGDSDPNNNLVAAVREPMYRGFLSIGELLNIKGFDATTPTANASPALTDYTLGRGDYIKAVSLLALIDTHFLTTRSNTYTAYVSLVDRESVASSIQSQVTFDRSDMLPRTAKPGGIETDPTATPWVPGSKPEIISQRRYGYFSTDGM